MHTINHFLPCVKVVLPIPFRIVLFHCQQGNDCRGARESMDVYEYFVDTLKPAIITKTMLSKIFILFYRIYCKFEVLW